MQIYVVEPGDTVDRIAQAYGVEVQELAALNQIPYPYALAVGQALLIPDGEAAKTRRIVSGGYLYTYITPWVLDNSLAYLSEVSVFSYGFSEDGELIGPLERDNWIVQRARAAGVRPILVLTPFNKSGNFDNSLIAALVRSETAKQRLFAELLFVLGQKGYAGVNVDFEYVPVEDKTGFEVFVAELAQVLHGEGYTMSVALAPKTYDGQPGLLYEGHDYAVLGAVADSVFLMTYEWGYTYGPNMAVAPLAAVRRVVDYALTRIPAEKMDLGIPNYGYDWALPYERGVTKARRLGNVEAVQLAIRYGVPILFDASAQSPYFRYEDGGVLHEVWFEDVRSLDAKLDLLEEARLRGCGFWQLMSWWHAGFALIGDRFVIDKE